MLKTIEQDYEALNRSYSREFVYHLGCEAGFFSEYNNMVLAMLYCAKHHIRFALYSSDANFSYEKGWTDYFEPFCLERGNLLHHWFNRRPNPRFKNAAFRGIDAGLTLLFRKWNPQRLTTADLWDAIRSQPLERFELPELGLNGSLCDACREMIRYTWRYNERTRRIVANHIQSLSLPAHYVGLHIRGGDKFIEARLQDIEVYIRKASELSDVRNAFVLTDDFGIIEALNTNYPEWTFYTLCAPEERGYYHQAFTHQSKELIWDRHIKLFASVDVLAASDYFIGTFSSNPGMYLGMRMDAGRAYSVDIPAWRIW